jgi:oxalate decarboxylase/phosphoglucose isomerase-like protein (cupin superfamily)
MLLGITREPWAEANFVRTAAGHARGNHYHRITTELFFVVRGEIEVAVHHVETGHAETFVAGPGDVFVVEPYELHVFTARTDAEWINMLSVAHDQDAPDFVAGPPPSGT